MWPKYKMHASPVYRLVTFLRTFVGTIQFWSCVLFLVSITTFVGTAINIHEIKVIHAKTTVQETPSKTIVTTTIPDEDKHPNNTAEGIDPQGVSKLTTAEVIPEYSDVFFSNANDVRPENLTINYNGETVLTVDTKGNIVGTPAWDKVCSFIFANANNTSFRYDTYTTDYNVELTLIATLAKLNGYDCANPSFKIRSGSVSIIPVPFQNPPSDPNTVHLPEPNTNDSYSKFLTPPELLEPGLNAIIPPSFNYSVVVPYTVPGL